jgi:hypothetical protein
VNPRRVSRLVSLHIGRLADTIRLSLFEAHRPSAKRQWASEADPTEQVRRALRRGCRFLERQQATNGRLRGFLLPPGASTTWITAHVAFVVEDVPALAELRAHAARFLARVGPADGGWGYNRRVGIDVDSTAQALIVLQRERVEVPDFLSRVLLAAQDRAGGFPTYPPAGLGGVAQHGWQRPHLDVSLMASLWLRRNGRFPKRLERCSKWICAEVSRTGVPASYWWPGPAYGLWAMARAGVPGVHLGETVAAACRGAREAPHVSMALVSALRHNVDPSTIGLTIARLLRLQLDDGSWPCAPCLRVTSPDCTASGGDAPGPVYADHWRVLSTAHSVAALHAARRLVTPCA